MTVVEVVWFCCSDCLLDGLYPVIEESIKCPDCGGIMQKVYTEKEKDRKFNE